MKRVKMNYDEENEDSEIYDEDGEAGYEQVDWKASPEEVLKGVESFLRHFGLEVTIGNAEDDQVYFKINNTGFLKK
jgi:hypothetical protein